MPPWQSSDNFQVSEHHPILRVGLTLHNPIAGLRKAVRPQELGWFLEDQQMGAWGTDCRPVLIWTVGKRFAHACITLSPKARLMV